jgi:hypothetical protein
MPLEDVYFHFLPSKLRMPFAIGLMFLAAVIITMALVALISPRKQRDD